MYKKSPASNSSLFKSQSDSVIVEVIGVVLVVVTSEVFEAIETAVDDVPIWDGFSSILRVVVDVIVTFVVGEVGKAVFFVSFWNDDIFPLFFGVFVDVIVTFVVGEVGKTVLFVSFWIDELLVVVAVVVSIYWVYELLVIVAVVVSIYWFDELLVIVAVVVSIYVLETSFVELLSVVVVRIIL